MHPLIRTSIAAALALLPLHAAQGADLARRAFMGIGLESVPDGHPMKELVAKDGGVLVERVIPGSSAEKAELRKGDIVVRVNGKTMRSSADVIGIVRASRAGEAMKLSLLRDGQSDERDVTLIGLPLEKAADYDTAYDAVEADGVLRRVIVTKPKGDSRHPAILLVGGIGCYSMDYPLDENATYRRLVSSFTRQGFATMRVEKSGMGDSEGAPCSQVDLKTEVKGYAAGLKALLARPDVDADNVFIVGHSIGGIVGPLVADEIPVRGLVVMETVGSTWFEYELINRRRQLRLAGTAPDKIGRQMQLKQWCMHQLLIERQPRAQILEKRKECAAEMEIPSSDSYLQQIADVDLPGLWTRVKSDTLVIYGGADFLTSAEEHREIVNALEAVRPGAATYVEIPDMDHYFFRMKDQDESFRTRRAGKEGEFHPEITGIIGRWLKERAARG